MKNRTQGIPERIALVLIDVQEGFKHSRWGKRNNPAAEAQIAKLLRAWRAANRPVIHVQHVSREPVSVFKPGAPGIEIQPFARPMEGEPLVQKHVHSAFIGTDLEVILKQRGITSLV